jgi:hypothetical protein
LFFDMYVDARAALSPLRRALTPHRTSGDYSTYCSLPISQPIVRIQSIIWNATPLNVTRITAAIKEKSQESRFRSSSNAYDLCKERYFFKSMILWPHRRPSFVFFLSPSITSPFGSKYNLLLYSALKPLHLIRCS